MHLLQPLAARRIRRAGTVGSRKRGGLLIPVRTSTVSFRAVLVSLPDAPEDGGRPEDGLAEPRFAYFCGHSFYRLPVKTAMLR